MAKLFKHDLIVDKLYEQSLFGELGTIKTEPISNLTGVGNQGGFRIIGEAKNPKLVVLYTDGSESEWPDTLDPYSGLFTYFGDNREPGKMLQEKKGNMVLNQLFEYAESDKRKVPPILIFQKGEKNRDVVFKGLAVPGARSISSDDYLVAIWRTKAGRRFQNYRSLFTILDEPSISHKWLIDIHNRNAECKNSPPSWLKYEIKV